MPHKPTPQVAQKIAQHGASVGATRVVFRADGELVTSPLDEVSIRSLLDEYGPEKYKLQAQTDGRWVNQTGYVSINVGRDIAQSVANLDLDVLRSAASEEIQRVEPRLMRPLREISRKASLVPRRTDSPLPGDALEVASIVNAAIRNDHTAYVAASLDVNDAVSGIEQDDLANGTHVDEALALIDQRVARRPELHETAAARAAVAVMRGKVVSTRSRAEAAPVFNAARITDPGGLIRDLYLDTGAWTYFDSPDIGPEDEALAAKIETDIAEAPTAPAENTMAIAVSVDPNYLRIYAPVLMHYAQELPDVDFNVILCGVGEVADRAFEDLEQLRHALARVALSDPPTNLRVRQIAVPAEVAEARTFYACARFFALQPLLDEYASVYFMDVDLTTDEDPRPFLRSVAGVPFGVPANRGLPALSPWRRYLAGNLAVNRSAAASRLVADMQQYLAHGLRRSDSWMLDQNALTYAIERNRGSYTSLNDYRRPFGQPRFRSVWEKNLLDRVSGRRR